MNIFSSDSDPVVCAQNLDDKRVIKMALESAQILSTALHNLGHWSSNLYRPTHATHPCVHWAGHSRGNFNWLVLHGLGLGEEYKYRFGASREHQSCSVILNCAEAFKLCRLDRFGMTPFANCTPFNGNDSTVNRYRLYLTQKWDASEPRWTKRDRPKWYKIKVAT
jgi:hypothetical protein